jgi:hypothetical protein
MGAGVIVVIAAVAGFFAWRTLREGGVTTAVPPSEALSRYRNGSSTSVATSVAPSSTIGAPAATAVLPAPGVYSYTTTGSDSVDALGGASHSYPATTTLTVRPAGCGVAERWVAAEERWDETVACSSGAGVLVSHFTGFHRFFGGDSTDDYTCSGGPRPVDAPAGTTWTTICRATDETATYHGSVTGREELTVAGHPVATLHVSTTIDDGDPSDHQVIDTWYQLDTDLVVRRIADIATSSSSPVGLVHYRESYQIDLQALAPQR